MDYLKMMPDILLHIKQYQRFFQYGRIPWMNSQPGLKARFFNPYSNTYGVKASPFPCLCLPCPGVRQKQQDTLKAAHLRWHERWKKDIFLSVETSGIKNV